MQMYKVNSNIKRTLTISMMNDVVYWMTIAAFISGSLVAVLPFTKTASILSSALVGSFIFIIPIDHYIGSSLKYILVNFVRRAYVDGFNLAVLNFPFQVKFFFSLFMQGFSGYKRSVNFEMPFWVIVLTKIPTKLH